jgi:c(7)-type cytochrome triheme protein
MKRTAISGIIITLLMTASAWGKVGGDDITFRVKAQGDVVFSHDIHVVKNNLKCAECHRLYAISNMHGGATMGDMQKGKYCGACHNAQRAFGIRERCDRCHKK